MTLLVKSCDIPLYNQFYETVPCSVLDCQVAYVDLPFTIGFYVCAMKNNL